jgi:light-harvesting complex II chlorophyll a/b binding protein 6
MAATSAAVLNGLGSSFLCGGKRSHTLLSASVGARVGGAAGPKKLIVMAAAQAKKSWVPGVRGGGNLIDPEWLDGS